MGGTEGKDTRRDGKNAGTVILIGEDDKIKFQPLK